MKPDAIENSFNEVYRRCRIGKVTVTDPHFRRVPHPPGPVVDYLTELGSRHAPMINEKASA